MAHRFLLAADPERIADQSFSRALFDGMMETTEQVGLAPELLVGLEPDALRYLMENKVGFAHLPPPPGVLAAERLGDLPNTSAHALWFNFRRQAGPAAYQRVRDAVRPILALRHYGHDFVAKGLRVSQRFGMELAHKRFSMRVLRQGKRKWEEINRELGGLSFSLTKPSKRSAAISKWMEWYREEWARFAAMYNERVGPRWGVNLGGAAPRIDAETFGGIERALKERIFFVRSARNQPLQPAVQRVPSQRQQFQGSSEYLVSAPYRDGVPELHGGEMLGLRMRQAASQARGTVALWDPSSAPRATRDWIVAENLKLRFAENVRDNPRILEAIREGRGEGRLRDVLTRTLDEAMETDARHFFAPLTDGASVEMLLEELGPQIYNLETVLRRYLNQR